MMESSESLPPVRKSGNAGMRVINFLSSLGLATVLLILLGILTWLATLEQIHNGLYPTLRKYFDYRAFYVLPDAVSPENTWYPRVNGNPLTIPLPGGYYVCALLTLNLLLGGILRIRKGWKQAGVLISHFGIILMLIGGGVTDHFSRRGNMAIHEGKVSDVAQDYFEWVIEAAEIKDNKPENIRVIGSEHLKPLEGESRRIFRLPDMPFDLEITGYYPYAVPIAATERAPRNGEPVFDGYFLEQQEEQVGGKAVEEERKMAGCHARLLYKNGEKSTPFILTGASLYPYTVRVDDRVFTIDMRKRLWPMPFEVRLDKFTADFHPGTRRASKFISDITRIENGAEAKVRIEMNEPMRYEGLTFFQASYGPDGAGPGDKLFSVFEVVKNPADKWPEYSLYIVTFGLLVHFIMKLAGFIGGTTSKKRNV
ncbi:cytochrome c biogenesis protein ResB [Luteolibacter sp. SL250]|uniref:cytochrome c biogenesis protein ResB n=1 Tax=Luteolibacter sp. SL250 TaxID=2995170 RepID=UPI0022715CD0|nr:cytochrome c biogenesis protein ResB [Luteolibacter sp. SL250]WAC17988.1 cytochrome c biogenesis protein ResB [Luteolibacter sp. SL250]